MSQPHLHTKIHVEGNREILEKLQLITEKSSKVQVGTCFVSCLGTNHEQWANMLELKSIHNYFKSSHCGEITLYLDRIH